MTSENGAGSISSSVSSNSSLSFPLSHSSLLICVFKEEKPESLSPSNDPYYDIPENVAELERRIADLKTGKSKSKILSKEAQKELLGL